MYLGTFLQLKVLIASDETEDSEERKKETNIQKGMKRRQKTGNERIMIMNEDPVGIKRAVLNRRSVDHQGVVMSHRRVWEIILYKAILAIIEKFSFVWGKRVP